MRQILILAYRLLVSDKGKYTALLVGTTFSVFLIVQMTSSFAGILTKASATVINVGASIWVMDPAATNTVFGSIPMPDYVLDAARSINGVKYAVPLYLGSALLKLQDGTYQSVTVIGLDDSSLVGRPQLLEGNIEDIFAENGFIAVKDEEFPKLHNPTLGTEFELNDHRGVIVGIAKVATGALYGTPTLYTTYYRAIQYIPSMRFTVSYILIEPKTKADIPFIQQQIARLGYLALTNREFRDGISDYLKYKTSIGTNTLLMTVISFIVGLSISGQTFYTFIIENLEHFGALKAMGAKGRELVYVIIFQAGFTALIGYGLGIGLSTMLITAAKMRLPEYSSRVTYTNLGLALVLVMLIATISGYAGVRRVLKIEPFDIFRG
ncbi:MAG TPA: ABC transporter permease [Candidatus Binataceae bacterium]|nr:ABC transporter permease [Candidatus Binataceae bacterium]